MVCKLLQWYASCKFTEPSVKAPTVNYKNTNQYGPATASQQAWVMGSFKVGRHTSNSGTSCTKLSNLNFWEDTQPGGDTQKQLPDPNLKGNKTQLSGTAKGMYIINPQFSSEQEFSLQNRLHNLVSHFHVLGTGNSKRSTVIRNHRKGWKVMMTSSTHATDRRKHYPAALSWDWSCMNQPTGGNTNTSSNGEL